MYLFYIVYKKEDIQNSIIFKNNNKNVIFLSIVFKSYQLSLFDLIKKKVRVP